MVPYVQKQLPDKHLSLHEKAVAYVERSSTKLFDGIRCHELARALSVVLEIPYQDGHFGISEHTWLPLEGAIIDPYMPGAIPQCVLTDTHWHLPFAKLYKPGPERTDIDQALVEAVVKFWIE